MPTCQKQFFVETVTETFNGHIIASDLRPATETDIQKTKKLHAEGKCSHNVIVDEPGWMYDFRFCAICNQPLGTV